MWRLESESGKAGIDDAIWRPTPRNLWELIFTSVFTGGGAENRFSAGHIPTHALEEMIKQVTGQEK